MRIKVSIGETKNPETQATPPQSKPPPPFPFPVDLGCDPQTVPDRIRCRYPQRGIFFAEELEPREEVVTDLMSGNIPELPKGRHMQELLNAEMQRETPKKELATVIRFPPDIASLLQRRIRLEDAGVPLGLEILPTPLEDYRIYDIRIALYPGDAKLLEEIRNNDSIDERLCAVTPDDHTTVDWISLRGILLELPTKVEIYKFVPWNLEDGYKANMIGQMIYVWNPNKETINISAFRAPRDARNQDPVSWYSSISGMAPGAYNIAERKFRRNDIYTREELLLAEYAIMEVMYSSYRDLLLLEASTEWDFVRKLARLKWEKDPDAVNKPGQASLPGVVDILGPDDAHIFVPNSEGNYDSDLDSDTFFSGHRFLKRDAEVEPDLEVALLASTTKATEEVVKKEATFDISDFKNT